MQQATAKLRFLRMAPRKVRLVADTIRGMHVRDAEAELLFRSRRAAEPMLKLLRSCIANATNLKMQPERLFVSRITVDQGPVLKRMLPRAMGRATPLLKKMSHVVLVLEEGTVSKPRFAIVTKAKHRHTDKPTKKKVGAAVKPEVKEKEQGKENPGFFRRIFRRKSV